MCKLKDLTGQTFGNLYVIERAPNGIRWQTRWNCVCDCGNKKIILTSNLTTGKSKSCGCGSLKAGRLNNEKAKLSEEIVQQKCSIYGFDYLRGFNGIQKNAWFQCKECNYQFEMQAEKIIYGLNQCPQCSIGNHGYLNSKFFEKNPNLKNIPCKVYLLKLHKNNEDFYKIGITRRTIKKRMQQIPYELIDSNYIETTFWNAYLIEKDLKKIIKKYHYKPSINFGGWTECFKIDTSSRSML